MNDQDDKTKPSNYLTSIYLLFRSFSIEVSITPQMGIQRFWFTKLIAPRIHIQKFPNNQKGKDFTLLWHPTNLQMIKTKTPTIPNLVYEVIELNIHRKVEQKNPQKNIS